MKKLICLVIALMLPVCAFAKTYRDSDHVGDWIYSSELSDGIILAFLKMTDNHIAYYMDGIFSAEENSFRYNRQFVGTWERTADGFDLISPSGEKFSGLILFGDYIALPMTDDGDYFIFGKCADTQYVYDKLK